MGDETFTIGTLAKRAAVNVQTIRYYERIGILPKPSRSKSGYRRYGEDALARLHFIRHAAQLGFTLAETKELLALRARRDAPCRTVCIRAEAKLATIDAKLQELRALRDAVAQLVRTCSGDTAIEHCSILAALGEPELQKGKSPCPRPSRPRPAARPPSHASTRANAASKSV